MKLEQAKPQMLPGVVAPSKKQVSARTIPLQAKAATPIQLQRAKARLEQDRGQIQRQAEQASIQKRLQDGKLYANDPALAAQLAQRSTAIDDELMACLERQEALA